MPNCPLMPNSANAIEGTMAREKKNKPARQNASQKTKSIFIHFSNTKYCNTYTTNFIMDLPAEFS